MEYHRSLLIQLIEPCQNLNNLILDPGLEVKFQERSLQLQEMINNSKAALRRLALAADHWNQFQQQADQVNQWLKMTNLQLEHFLAKPQKGGLTQDDCFQYWVSFKMKNLNRVVNFYSFFYYYY